MYNCSLFNDLHFNETFLALNRFHLSYSYAEGSESASAFSERRFVRSATWYLQHVQSACGKALSERNATIRVLSDEMIAGLPASCTTLVCSLRLLSFFC